MKYALPTVAVILLLLPDSASAHLVSTRFGELYSGLLHPLLALQHIVPWFGLGLLGALASKQSSRWLLGAFPLAVFGGVLIGAQGPELAVITWLNIASFVVVGLLVVGNARLPFAALIGLSVLFGLSHGYANTAVGIGGNPLLLYTLGVGIAAYIIITLVTAGAHLLATRRQWGRVAVRAAGSWIVATGIVFGGFSMLAVGA